MPEAVIVPIDEDARDFVIRYLSEHGFPERQVNEAVAGGIIASSEVELVLDRGVASADTISDYEKGVMKRRSLTADDVVHATGLVSLAIGASGLRISQGEALVLYESGKLERLSDHASPASSLHTPKEGYTFNDALIAVFTHSLP